MNMPMPYHKAHDAGENGYMISVNQSSHHNWPAQPEYGDISSSRCQRCSCKLVHQAASYPCGVDVPRQMMVNFTDGTTEFMTMEHFKELTMESVE